MDLYNCVNYNPNFIDLFLPSYHIIYKFCLSNFTNYVVYFTKCRIKSVVVTHLKCERLLWAVFWLYQ